MTQKIVNLKDLFLYQGREMYNVAKKTQKEIPVIKGKAHNAELKLALERELDAASEQRTRLEKAFSMMNESPAGETGEWTDWMFRRTTTILNNCSDPEVCDAAIVNAVQQMNHTKIAAYGTLCAYAKEIGRDEIAEVLAHVLREEKEIDKTLTGIAERKLNREAVTGAAL